MLSDTHTTQVLVRYGSESQKETWLLPLLDGKIRSCFAMTEPAVASSDATNIQSSIKRDGDEYVVNGHKHWTSGTRLQAAQAHTHIRTYTRNAHIYTHWYTGVKRVLRPTQYRQMPSGAMDPRCKVSIFMGKTDTSAPIHAQQSMIIVPMDAPGMLSRLCGLY